MNTSMSNGVSALNSFQKAIAVQSNNAANTETMAFKADFISFSDMMYDQQVGRGVSMNEPIKQFNQGQLQPTNMEYDFALKGDGFFTVASPQDPTVQYYTRAGQFKSDVNSLLVDPNGMLVQGVNPVISGDKITKEFTQYISSTTIENETEIKSMNTFTTDFTKTATITGTTGQNYKTVGANINDIKALSYEYKNALSEYAINPIDGDEAVSAQKTVEFTPLVAINEAYTVEVSINGVKFQQNFDTDVATTLNNLSDNINEYTGISSSVDSATGVITIDSMIPGKKISVSKAKLNDNNMIIKSIATESGSGLNLVNDIYTKLQTLLTANGAQIATNTSTIPKSVSGEAVTQSQVLLDLDQLGMSDDMFGTLKNENGNLYLTQGDASFLVGKLAPVNFFNSSLLRPEGNNLYSKSEDSGDPIYIKDSAEVVNNYLEASGVDLSEELVNILTFQKAFEANSKSITTSDELMKTALALKNK